MIEFPLLSHRFETNFVIVNIEFRYKIKFRCYSINIKMYGSIVELDLLTPLPSILYPPFYFFNIKLYSKIFFEQHFFLRQIFFELWFFWKLNFIPFFWGGAGFNFFYNSPSIKFVPPIIFLFFQWKLIFRNFFVYDKNWPSFDFLKVEKTPKFS